jgi:hypothetical protein
LFDGIGRLVSGNYEIRGGREGKIVVGFAIGILVFVVGVVGVVGYVTLMVEKEMQPETSPLAHGEYWLAVETQKPYLKDFMNCDNPIPEMTQGIVRATTKVQWSCTGYCGFYDMHYYETLSNGVKTSICAEDYVRHD